MTNLLDLPPEVFQTVIHAVVSNAGVHGAWKQRQVCRVFAAEIRYNVFAKQGQDAFKLCERNARAILSKQIWLYLFYRTKQPLDALPELPNKVREMVQYLMSDSDGHTKLGSHDEVTESVCKVLGDNTQPYEFRMMIGMVPRIHLQRELALKDLNKDLRVSDKIAVAGALGNLSLVKTLLPQLPEDMQPRRSYWQFDSVFGDVLVNASRSGHHLIVEGVFEYLDKSKGQKDSAYEIIIQYYFPGDQLSVFNQAVFGALKNGHVDILKTLLKMHKFHGRRLEKRDYNVWLQQAVKSLNAENVRNIMQIKGISQPRVLLATFQDACASHNAEIVLALLVKGGMSANEAYRNWSPLLAAIRLGNEEMVDAVLDAGANVDGVRWRNQDGILPIEVAMRYGQFSMVKILIERGACLVKVNLRDASRVDIYDLVRDAKAHAESEASEQPK